MGLPCVVLCGEAVLGLMVIGAAVSKAVVCGVLLCMVLGCRMVVNWDVHPLRTALINEDSPVSAFRPILPLVPCVCARLLCLVRQTSQKIANTRNLVRPVVNGIYIRKELFNSREDGANMRYLHRVRHTCVLSSPLCGSDFLLLLPSRNMGAFPTHPPTPTPPSKPSPANCTWWRRPPTRGACLRGRWWCA